MTEDHSEPVNQPHYEQSIEDSFAYEAIKHLREDAELIPGFMLDTLGGEKRLDFVVVS